MKTADDLVLQINHYS